MDRERGRNGRFFGIIRRQDRHRGYSLKQRRDLSDAYAGISVSVWAWPVSGLGAV